MSILAKIKDLVGMQKWKKKNEEKDDVEAVLEGKQKVKRWE